MDLPTLMAKTKDLNLNWYFHLVWSSKYYILVAIFIISLFYLHPALHPFRRQRFLFIHRIHVLFRLLQHLAVPVYSGVLVYVLLDFYNVLESHTFPFSIHYYNSRAHATSSQPHWRQSSRKWSRLYKTPGRQRCVPCKKSATVVYVFVNDKVHSSMLICIHM
jgi:hypothetical protein